MPPKLMAGRLAFVTARTRRGAASPPPRTTAIRRPRRLPLPTLPREHGAWAWLLLPLVAGGAAADRFSPPVVLYPLAVLFAYTARAPAAAWLRRRHPADLAWTVVFALLALATGVPAVLLWQRWWLLPMSVVVAAGPLAVNASRSLKTRLRTEGELLVVASLALLATATRYAAEGKPDAGHLLVWLPVALYGWASVFYVRMVFHHRGAGRLADPAVWYHLGLVVVLAAAAVSGAIPPLAPLAFLPLLAKVALAVARPPAGVRPTTTGFLEAAHAAAFAALLVTAYRLS